MDGAVAHDRPPLALDERIGIGAYDRLPGPAPDADRAPLRSGAAIEQNHLN